MNKKTLYIASLLLIIFFLFFKSDAIFTYKIWNNRKNTPLTIRLIKNLMVYPEKDSQKKCDKKC